VRLTTILKVVAVVSLPISVVLLVLTIAPVGMLSYGALAGVFGAVATHAIVALGLATARERGKARWLMDLGLVTCVAGLIGWLWVSVESYVSGLPPSQLPLLPSVLTGWAAMVMAAGMALAQAARSRAARVVRIGTAGLALVLAVVWTPTAWSVAADAPEMSTWGRIVAVLSMLAVSGLIANLVMARSPVDAPSDTDEAAVEGNTVDVACPRCAHWQSLRLDGATCVQCGLRIKVQIP
jgi:hypothetical protein